MSHAYNGCHMLIDHVDQSRRNANTLDWGAEHVTNRIPAVSEYLLHIVEEFQWLVLQLCPHS